jgi:hypothetical protein
VLRTFTITDLGLLNTYKKKALFLHNQLVLTQGSAALRRAAWLSPFAVFNGTFTYICFAANDGRALIGQVRHTAQATVARCTFLAPREALDSPLLAELLEQLLMRVGTRGAQALLADIEEGGQAFTALRQSGFSSYARQRVWQLSKTTRRETNPASWRPVFERDELTVNLLRNSLMPGQVQQIEGDNLGKLEGYVYYRGDELQAYVEVKRGPRGVWLQPFFHLDAVPVEQMLADLVANLHPRPSRPLYVSLRSYQDWLEAPLQDLGARPGPYQAAMARRTVLPLKVEDARRVPVPNRRTEPTTPIHALIPNRHVESEWTTYDQTPNYR